MGLEKGITLGRRKRNKKDWGRRRRKKGKNQKSHGKRESENHRGLKSKHN